LAEVAESEVAGAVKKSGVAVAPKKRAIERKSKKSALLVPRDAQKAVDEVRRAVARKVAEVRHKIEQSSGDDFKAKVNDVVKKVKEKVREGLSPKAYADIKVYNGLSEEQKIVNAEFIFDYLFDLGWSIQAIAAVLGNIERESQLNPATYQGNVRDFNKRLGYGLFQWTPQREFLKDEAGRDYYDKMAQENPHLLILEQLDFFITTRRDRWYSDLAVRGYEAPYAMNFSDFIKSTTCPRELAVIFQTHYLRSSNSAEGRIIRTDNAEKWFEYFSSR